jgi:CheY-like chemotaxis protein
VQFVQFAEAGTMAEQVRVLVVDDEAAIRRVLGQFLEGRGCAVREAANGVDALAWILSTALDVVVSDLMMPEMDGLALWRRASASRPALCRRWVVISAHPLPEELATAGVLYLQKPADLEAVWAAVRVAVG